MRRSIRGSVFALITVMASAANAAAVQRFEKFVATVKTARIQFEQQVADRDKKITQRTSGELTIERPGKFRWATAKPYKQLIVGDGNELWIFDEDLNQVTVKPQGKALGTSPALLLAGSAEVNKAFTLRDAGEAGGLDWLEAKPKDKDAGFDAVRIGFAGDEPRKLEILDGFGQLTTVTLTKFEANAKVDAGQFKFVVPTGADVLRQ